jgi:hypothetical protein
VVLVPPEWLSQEYPVHTVEMEKDDHHTFLDIDTLYLASCLMSRWHTAMLAECQLKTSSCLLACHPGSYSVFLYPIKDDMGLKTTSVCSILYDCGRVYIGQTGHSIEPKVKERYWHIQLGNTTNRRWLNTYLTTTTTIISCRPKSFLPNPAI